MLRLLIGSLCLTSCYQPALLAGAPCTTDHDCPLDQVCRNQRCELEGTAPGGKGGTDAGTMDAADGRAGDRDRDGLLDQQDNCPDIANPDQANEDGDKFGDLCDPCPIVADDAPADTDRDGVADACDPHPTAAGDKIALFEGFRGGLPGWARSAGWYAVSGAVSVSATAASDEWLVLPVPAGDRVEVTARISVDRIDGTNTDHVVGVFAPYQASTDRGIGCSLFQTNDVATARGLELSDDFQDRRLASSGLVWATTTAYVLDMVRSGTSYQCTARDGARSVTAQGSSSSSATPPSLGILAYALNTTIQWVLVVQSP